MKEIVHYSDNTIVIKKLLEDIVCDSLIRESEAVGFDDAPITTSSGPVMRQDIRNNTRVIIDRADMADQMWRLCRDYMFDEFKGRIAIGLNERFRFYRYDKGEQFDWHHDGYYERDNGERSQFTLMFYLNDDYIGGTTDFGEFSITPEKGDALLFWHHQIHRGSPVISGTKYVIRTDVMYSNRT
ncbi:hypothetical protein A9Q99_17135 [Gammaproteobacteria bacterium 45_16_T64]|nr:hypothetical protein A9Q99_17135 [Gammaproteobacteria bacterium 45_16_T64]